MRIVTPSSLKWLLDQHARLQGEINREEKRQRAAEEANAQRLAELQANLRAISRALSLHAIAVPEELITPIGVNYRRHELAYGDLTRYILAALAAADGEVLTTTEVTIFVATSVDPPIEEPAIPVLRVAVRKRLKSLCAQGRAQRLHSKKTASEGRWRAVSPDR